MRLILKPIEGGLNQLALFLESGEMLPMQRRVVVISEPDDIGRIEVEFYLLTKCAGGGGVMPLAAGGGFTSTAWRARDLAGRLIDAVRKSADEIRGYAAELGLPDGEDLAALIEDRLGGGDVSLVVKRAEGGELALFLESGEVLPMQRSVAISGDYSRVDVCFLLAETAEGGVVLRDGRPDQAPAAGGE